jgi:hypothetical protein
VGVAAAAQYIDLTVSFELPFSSGTFNSFLADMGRNRVYSTCFSDQTAHYVKKPPIKVNVIDFEFFGFNVIHMGPLRVPLVPKSHDTLVIIQIHKICGEEQGAFCSM